MMSILTDSLLVFQQTARKKSVLDLLFLVSHSYDAFSVHFPLITNNSKMLDLCIPFANDSVMILLQTGYVLCHVTNIIIQELKRSHVPLKLMILSIPVISVLISLDFFVPTIHI